MNLQRHVINSQIKVFLNLIQKGNLIKDENGDIIKNNYDNV